MMFAQQKQTDRPEFVPVFARRARAGVMLLEVVAGIVLLLAAIGLVVQILAGEAAAQRATQHKLFAIELLSNMMEEQTALPYNEVSPQALAELKLPSEAHQLLPGATIKATVDPSDGPIKGKRLTLEITWPDRTGEASQPVRLSAWIYPVSTTEAQP